MCHPGTARKINIAIRKSLLMMNHCATVSTVVWNLESPANHASGTARPTANGLDRGRRALSEMGRRHRISTTMEGKGEAGAQSRGAKEHTGGGPDRLATRYLGLALTTLEGDRRRASTESATGDPIESIDRPGGGPDRLVTRYLGLTLIPLEGDRRRASTESATGDPIEAIDRPWLPRR